MIPDVKAWPPDWVAPLLEGLTDGVAVLDAKGYIVSANQALVELTGYGRDELHGLHLRSLFPDAEEAQKTVENGVGRWIGEAELARRDNHKLPLTLSITPARDADGSSLGFVMLLRGVYNGSGENKSLDEAEAKLREFEHELRNVFTVIAGNVSMMNGTIEDVNLKRRLTIMQTAVKSGMDILERMRQTANK